MYLDNALNVDLRLGTSMDFKEIPEITKVIQVFPDEPDLAHMHIVYMDSTNLEKVKKSLEEHSSVELVERIPVRTIATNNLI